MMLKCKNSLQFLWWKENLLPFFSMKMTFHFLTEYFQMKRSIRKTLCFSEWKILSKRFYKNSRSKSFQPFTLWSMNLNKKMKKRITKMHNKVEFIWIWSLPIIMGNLIMMIYQDISTCSPNSKKQLSKLLLNPIRKQI